MYSLDKPQDYSGPLGRADANTTVSDGPTAETPVTSVVPPLKYHRGIREVSTEGRRRVSFWVSLWVPRGVDVHLVDCPRYGPGPPDPLQKTGIRIRKNQDGLDD